MQVTLSITEAAVNWRLLSKAIWMELCETRGEHTKYYIREHEIEEKQIGDDTQGFFGLQRCRRSRKPAHKDSRPSCISHESEDETASASLKYKLTGAIDEF